MPQRSAIHYNFGGVAFQQRRLALFDSLCIHEFLPFVDMGFILHAFFRFNFLHLYCTQSNWKTGGQIRISHWKALISASLWRGNSCFIELWFWLLLFCIPCSFPLAHCLSFHVNENLTTCLIKWYIAHDGRFIVYGLFKSWKNALIALSWILLLVSGRWCLDYINEIFDHFITLSKDTVAATVIVM